MYTKSASCCTHGPKNLAPRGFLRGGRRRRRLQVGTPARQIGTSAQQVGILLEGGRGETGFPEGPDYPEIPENPENLEGPELPEECAFDSVFLTQIKREKNRCETFLIFAWLFGMDNLLLQLTMIGLALCWQSAPSSTKRWRTDTHARGQRPAQHVPDTTNNN